MTSSHGKNSVLTYSSAGVTVFLNDFQLTQQHAEMTSSHGKNSVLTYSSAGVTVFLYDLQLTQQHAEMTSSHDYSAQCLPTAVQA